MLRLLKLDEQVIKVSLQAPVFLFVPVLSLMKLRNLMTMLPVLVLLNLQIKSEAVELGGFLCRLFTLSLPLARLYAALVRIRDTIAGLD